MRWNLTIAVFAVLTHLPTNAQEAKRYLYDDRGIATSRYSAMMDIPGTHTFHLQSDLKMMDLNDSGQEVLVAPVVEDMGSLQLQILDGGTSPCKIFGTPGKTPCKQLDITWVWISHVKPGSVPLTCSVEVFPGGVALSKDKITPGVGPQEKQSHEVEEYPIDATTSIQVHAAVGCWPPEEVRSDAHHKCNAGESTGCTSAGKAKAAIRKTAAPPTTAPPSSR